MPMAIASPLGPYGPPMRNRGMGQTQVVEVGPLSYSIPGKGTSLLDIAGDIPMPEIEPQLEGTPGILTPTVAIQAVPATPAGHRAPGTPARELTTWEEVQTWANENRTAVLIASAVVGAMVLFGGRKR
ncbi:MAG: hypothetical protein L0Y56_22370 [Nitrospira sp.]|nr:hypothetical protein [Nitrospira sp.]